MDDAGFQKMKNLFNSFKGQPNKKGAGKNEATLGRTVKNWDVSTGPLACPFARSLATLTCSLAPRSLLRSRSATFTHPLARSLPRSWESELLDGYFVCVFFYFRP